MRGMYLERKARSTWMLEPASAAVPLAGTCRRINSMTRASAAVTSRALARTAWE